MRTVRIVDDVLYDHLSAAAKQDRRSLQDYVALVLEQHIATAPVAILARPSYLPSDPSLTACTRCHHVKRLHSKSGCVAGCTCNASRYREPV